MTRSWLRRLAMVVAWSFHAIAYAQAGAPDVRNVRPVIMLLVDTSGSMERLPSCRCTTSNCEECFPACTGSAATDQRNRWSSVLEVLTGNWSNFTCGRQNRTTGGYVGAYDYQYYIPHFTQPATAQATDGILDVYVDRVKFGLMTFDGVGTLVPRPPLVTAAEYNTAAFLTQASGSSGMYSYGSPKSFTFPGCGQPYMIDNGARSETADAGRMVSVGSDSVDTRRTINAAIQTSLLSVRPFGATPIAGMLDDFRYYLDNNADIKPIAVANGPGDAYAQCRDRYAILLTDGFPNADMRESPYSCETPGYTCPYQRSTEIAADLCTLGSSGACTGKIKGLYVVGFNISDPAATAVLNDIAALGGTTSALFADNQTALMTQLASIIDRAATGTTTRTVPAFSSSGSAATVQRQLEFTTGFQMGDAGQPWTGVLERRRFECNGTTSETKTIDDAQNDRFQVVLNRRSTPRRLLTVIPNNAANLDDALSGEDVGIPPLGVGGDPTAGGHGGKGSGGASSSCASGGGNGNGNGNNGNGNGNGNNGNGNGNGNNGNGNGSSSSTAVETGLRLEAFSTTNSRVSSTILGASSASERDTIIRWVDGAVGSARQNNRLGDIYNSSPVIVGPPKRDIADESFNLYRQLPDVQSRPTVLYVGSNDGILHAFAAEDITITQGSHAGTHLAAGEELWGFIPPILLPKLKSAMTSHQWMFDGTPVVKDIFYRRLPGQTPSATLYRTVLVSGLRGGGAGYIALDVTDPLDPKFLWQFANADLGNTYGTPALGQVLVNSGGVVQERGLVLLPGGVGDDLTTSLCGAAVPMPDGRMSKPLGCPSNGKGRPPVTQGTLNARENKKCWGTRGRHVYFVDLATGELMRHLDDKVFNAPLSGGVSLFTGEVGTIASKAYLTDEDGVIWRLDISSMNMSDWDADPIHDIFYDGDAVDGQPSYWPPILSTDKQGRTVIIQATGNIDALDSLATNRVASLTDLVTFNSSTGAVTSTQSSLNWEIRLAAGQLVTGPLELFDSKVYFATFQSASNPLDACRYGDSHIWGVDYLQATSSRYPLPGLESVAGSGVFTLHNVGPFSNQLIMGVAITQRPKCVVGVEDFDPYFGGQRFIATDTGGGTFELVAQVSGGGTRTADASLAKFVRQLQTPLSYTRAQSWAGAVE